MQESCQVRRQVEINRTNEKITKRVLVLTRWQNELKPYVSEYNYYKVLYPRFRGSQEAKRLERIIYPYRRKIDRLTQEIANLRIRINRLTKMNMV